KLNGVMPATTPSGWRIEATTTRVETWVDSSPFSCTLMPQASSTISMPRATSPRASECTLPCSAVISSAISSRCASSSSRYLNRIAVRRASEEVPQVVKASLAAATAASTSSAVANATCFSWTPVAGFQTGPKRPEVPSTGLPPMKWLMVFMCCDGPFGRRGVLQVAAADGDLALVLLAGPDGRLAAGHLGHRHVPPRLGGGSGGRRVGLDVHARRAVRGAGLGER